MTSEEEAAPVAGASEAVPQPSTDAVVGSHNPIGGGTESACDDVNNMSSASGGNAGTSTVTSDGGKIEKPLELADELFERGSKALKDGDFAEATDCCSRALEIRSDSFLKIVSRTFSNLRLSYFLRCIPFSVKMSLLDVHLQPKS